MEICIQTPAKINLFLEILNLRPDGYHELISVVQLVSLYDTITFQTSENKNKCVIECPPEISKRENSIRNAVDAYRTIADFDTGVKVLLKKEIPIGGGLGGESSDAAATLKAMSVLADEGVCQDVLLESAAALGSDVPLFMGSPASIVTGRGEVVHPIYPRVDYRVVLVYPGFPVDTRQAYSWYDRSRQNGESIGVRGTMSRNMLEAMYRGDVGKWNLKNSFKTVISEKHPLIAQVESDLLDCGASHAGITGSGSSIIGIFRDDRDAVNAAAAMKNRYPFVRLLTPLEKQIDTVLKLV